MNPHIPETILLIVGIGLCTLGMRQLFPPDRYQASAQIKAINGMGTNGWRLIQAEMEFIDSREFLGRVAGSNKMSLDSLMRGSKARPVRGTFLISIGFVDDDPEKAADIANAIAQTWLQVRLEQKDWVSDQEEAGRNSRSSPLIIAAAKPSWTPLCPERTLGWVLLFSGVGICGASVWFAGSIYTKTPVSQRCRKRLSGIVLLILGTALVGLGLGEWVKLTQYQGTVIVKLGGSGDSKLDADDLIKHEFEIIRSHVILLPAIQAMDDVTRRSLKHSNGSVVATMRTLSRGLKLHPAPNIGAYCFYIRFVNHDPEKAVQVVNAVGEAYRQYQLQQARARLSRSIKELASKLQEVREKVAHTNLSVERTPEEAKGLQLYSNFLAQEIEIKKDTSGEPIFQTEIVSAKLPPAPIHPNRLIGTALLVCGLGIFGLGLRFLLHRKGVSDEP